MDSTAEAIGNHVKAMAELRKTSPPGPWMQEPDRVEFKHAGLQCLLSRGPYMSWCGYVGVPKDHPAYGQHYNDVSVDVHGGLTYSEVCSGAICHIPEAGEEDHLQWFGFDCAHLGDMMPRASGLSFEGDIYRSVKYVESEVKRLAEQLTAMVPNAG